MSDITTVSTPTPKPGYLTTEFWTTLFVHALALVTFILGALHVSWHDPGVSTFIPVGAVIFAGVAQAAYSDKRTQVKLEQAAQWGRVEVARAEHGISPVVNDITNLIHTLHEYGPDIQDALEQTNPSAAHEVGDVLHVADQVSGVLDKVVPVDTPPEVITPAPEAPTEAAQPPAVSTG